MITGALASGVAGRAKSAAAPRLAASCLTCSLWLNALCSQYVARSPDSAGSRRWRARHVDLGCGPQGYVARSHTDLVRDLYLKELKAYKAPERSADDHKGYVREFSKPQAPKAPAVPSSSDVASQLEAFTSSEPDAPEKTVSAEDDAAVEQQDINEYLKELQADVKVEKAHH